ncbi:sterol desaturase family protein [Undibacterium sp. TS12]|uniref:sterol desaturase family protein n=1 Tax=Undibacterium sp. TS12 TaxID=2908202 RepID=UPI001F4CC7D7|nr:sterol desaturase family protein [Undibacterium sp. TS12]MCH8622802.1 sterol desaturase family protein [Undibacterium sp. TS12]
MRYLISRTFFPAAVLGSFLLFLHVRAQGGNAELAILLSGVIIVALSSLLERWMPYKASWNLAQGDLATDIASTGILVGIIEPLLKWAGPVLVLSLYGWLQLPAGLHLFPVSLPFTVQVILAGLAVELGSYWSHRWHHTARRLWWLHAMHHSSERLYTINNFRFHPLNHLVNYLLAVFPLMLIGTPAEVLLAYVALSQPVLMLQHANLPLQNGIWNYVFSTNEVHRWHHSSQTTEANHNYGRAFLIWDWVFGTFYFPTRQAGPRQIGLFASSRYPGSYSYARQIASMFAPHCCK